VNAKASDTVVARPFSVGFPSSRIGRFTGIVAHRVAMREGRASGTDRGLGDATGVVLLVLVLVVVLVVLGLYVVS